MTTISVTNITYTLKPLSYFFAVVRRKKGIELLCKFNPNDKESIDIRFTVNGWYMYFDVKAIYKPCFGFLLEEGCYRLPVLYGFRQVETGRILDDAHTYHVDSNFIFVSDGDMSSYEVINSYSAGYCGIWVDPAGLLNSSEANVEFYDQFFEFEFVLPDGRIASQT